MTAGSYSTLTDGNATTGHGTNNGTTEWIEADFGQPKLVSSVTVGGGSIPSWGGVATYLNNRTIRYSNDRVNWTIAVNITGVTDSGATQFKKFTLDSPVSARYWRIFSSGYLATTEFKLE
ncbi:MAG: discoidin domain-containing protein [Leptolyngbyaceae cyanobacterium RM1_405_57]|nr:discoidin domain-containing protein [Leptolyngbyaceae cyanobacterium RM1_405_57]